MARAILGALGKPESLMQYVPDRAGHDRRYASTAPSCRRWAGAPPHVRAGAGATVRWYVENEDWWRPIKSGEYLEYYRQNYGNRATLAPLQRAGA